VYTSYHVHSRWSDGNSDIAALLAAAREAGLDEIGISDHYTMAPDGAPVSWSMPLDRLGEYLAEIRVAASALGERPIVRYGVEADYFPGQEEALREVLAAHPFDYVIGSVHFVDGFPIDANHSHWERLSPGEREQVFRGYWERIAGLARSGLADIVGHLDLTKKFGFRPTTDLSREIDAALAAIAASGMAVEINTAGWHTVAREAYPEPALLRACRAYEIPLLINADAHAPAFLTRDYDRAHALARDAGYTHLVRFAGRRQSLHLLRGG
jgi:histidinol-phosphatase (PHP family)